MLKYAVGAEQSDQSHRPAAREISSSLMLAESTIAYVGMANLLSAHRGKG